MKAEEVFGVVVRTVGLFLVLWSFSECYKAIAHLSGPGVDPGSRMLLLWRYLLYPIGGLVVGGYLLGGAALLLRFAYGRKVD